MKRLVAALLCLMLFLFSSGAYAEAFGGSGMLNPRDRWLDDLGDAAAETADLLANMDVEYQSAPDAAYLTLTNASHSVGLRLVRREGRTYLMTGVKRAVPLTYDLVGLLNGTCSLERVNESCRTALAAALAGMVSDVPAYDDVYNSLFTACRFLEMDGTAAADFLAAPAIAALLPMTGVSAGQWQSAAETGSVHAELTVYQAGNQMLATVDLSAPDMPNAYISYLQDDTGLTFRAAADMQPVSDWDDALEEISRGERPTGSRIDAFILQFDDLNGKETYLEFTRAAGGTDTTFELSNVPGENGDAALEIMVKKNGLRMLGMELTLQPGTGVELPDEPELLDDDLAEEELAAYFSAMDGGFETLLPAIHALMKN